jgi:opacity protein-like surface antigen
MNKIAGTILLALILNTHIGFSQSKLIVQFSAGYLLPLPDFKGNIPYSPGENNYHIKSGFNFGASGKYALDKNNMFRVTASLIYNMCSNSGDIEGITNSYEGHKINIFTAGAGGEFAYTKFKKFVPFIGAEFTANLFSGKYEIEIGDTVYNTSNLKSEWRFGILVNGGADIRLEKDMGIVLGIKYNMANLIGKNSSSSSTELMLNDEEYTVNGKQITSKNIQYLQLYAGLSIYFMQPKKKLKK